MCCFGVGWCHRHHFWRPEEVSPVWPIHIKTVFVL